MPRPAAFPGDWEVRYKNLRLDSAFRCQQGIREPLEEPSDIEAELRRVFGDAGQPLRDDPANGLRYHLLLVVPTPHCGIVSWECPGKPDVLLNYTPAYSDSVHPLPGLLALAQAETVSKFGQLVSDYSDELADAFPSKQPVRLEELSFADRCEALRGLGDFADPLARRLQAVPRRRPAVSENKPTAPRRLAHPLRSRRLRP